MRTTLLLTLMLWALGCQGVPCEDAFREAELPTVEWSAALPSHFGFLGPDGRRLRTDDVTKIPASGRASVVLEAIQGQSPLPSPLVHWVDLRGEGPFVARVDAPGQGLATVFSSYRGHWQASRLQVQLQLVAEKIRPNRASAAEQASVLWDGEIPKKERGLLPHKLDHHRRQRWIDAQMPMPDAFLATDRFPSAVLLMGKDCLACLQVSELLEEEGCRARLLDVEEAQGKQLVAYLRELPGKHPVSVPALILQGRIFYGVDPERMRSQLHRCGL